MISVLLAHPKPVQLEEAGTRPSYTSRSEIGNREFHGAGKERTRTCVMLCGVPTLVPPLYEVSMPSTGAVNSVIHQVIKCLFQGLFKVPTVNPHQPSTPQLLDSSTPRSLDSPIPLLPNSSTPYLLPALPPGSQSSLDHDYHVPAPKRARSAVGSRESGGPNVSGTAARMKALLILGLTAFCPVKILFLV